MKGWKNSTDRRSGTVCVCCRKRYDSRPQAVVLEQLSTCSGCLPTHTVAHRAPLLVPYILQSWYGEVTMAKMMVNSISTVWSPLNGDCAANNPQGRTRNRACRGNFTWTTMSSAAEFHGVPFISFWLTMLSGHCSECPHLYLLVETFSLNRFWVSSLKLRSCIHFYFGLLLEVKGKDAALFSDIQLFS